MGHNLISNAQHEFLSRRSTVTQLLDTLYDWNSSIQAHRRTDCIYIDLRKAFDSVVHSKLLLKLTSYGLEGNVLKWISDFLSGREQFVHLNGISSATVFLTSGVPQVSILGPMLFFTLHQ